MKCLALDFGGSSVKYGLVDDNAVITKNGKVPAPIKSRAMFIDTVSSLFELYKDQVEGIAISLPGYIDSGTGLLTGSGAYQALYGCKIPEILNDRCGNVKITVENDGKCGALSECWQGELKDCKDGVVIIIGSALAGGIIKDGRIHSGKGFAAGEFSFALTEPGKKNYSAMAMMHCCLVGMIYKLCKIKNLDLQAQGYTDLISLFDQMFGKEYPTFSEAPAKITLTGETIMEWVEKGDPDALAVYRDFISSLAMLIFNIQVLYAPEKIVIGGGLSRSERVFQDLHAELKSYYDGIFMFGNMRAEVVKSKYLDECNLLGAAYYYFHS